MKKIIFSGLMLTAAATLSAQEITMNRVHNPNQANTVSSTTMTVPQHIAVNFQTRYPGMTVIEWVPMGSWWKATYQADNRINAVYYNDAGDTYRVALPVLHNHVPDEVIATALEQYGPAVYGLATMKDREGKLVYQVHLIENGNSRMTWIDARGNEMTNVFRDKDRDDEVTMNMNQ